VKEILPAASELVSADLIILSRRTSGTFRVGPTVATDLIVGVRNPREIATIAAKVADLLPDTRPIIRDEIARTYDAVFDWRGGVIIILVPYPCWPSSSSPLRRLGSERRGKKGDRNAEGDRLGDR